MSDLSIFFKQGEVIEMRALGKTRNAVQSGYFKDFAKLEDKISILDTTGEHKGIYFVLNKINPALYARRPDSLSQPRESITTTSDSDIERRYWLPVDFDPTRPAEISSTNEEHDNALLRARDVREHLRSLGWPEPVYADSGNGSHLLYSIDLPNNDSSTETVELVLKALDALFSDDKVKIDTKNYNAARIWKAYGTMARKGANVTDRPWRRSKVIDVPSTIKSVPIELLSSLAWSFKQKEHREKYEPTGKIDLEQWLSSHGLDVVKRKTAHGGGTLFILENCPWNSQHSDRSAWAVQFPSGAIAAGCHHDGCAGNGWRELRNLFDPIKEEIRPKQEIKRPKVPALELRLEDVADIDYNDKGETESIRFNPARAADAISQYLHIISTPDKKIWVYENGYYRPDGEVIIEQTFDRVATSCYTINAAKETLKKIYLRNLIPFEDLDKNPYLLCCKNGVVDLLTGAFSEHSPEYYMTMPCQVEYRPEAIAKCFVQFLEESCSNDDDRLTLIDWLVAIACLIEFEYILFLTGHGGNGKKVYEKLIQEIFGADSSEAISLDELTNSKFAMGYLRRARVCISTETNPGKITTELAKRISGGDWMSSDVKNRDRVRFRPFTQLTWDSNGMPIFDDNSDGFKRRFTRVNMPFKFVDDPDPNDPMQKKKDPHLGEKLTTPEELSGILNLIIARAKEIARDGLIHRREDDFEEYEKQCYSVSDFIDRFIEFKPEYRDSEDYQESGDYLYAKFEEYTKYIVGAKSSRKKFSRLIGNQNGETSRTITKLNMPIRGFRGLSFDEIGFKAFIAQKTKDYKHINYSNDSLTISNEKNRIQENDLTILTIYRRILNDKNLCNIPIEKEKGKKIVRIVRDQQTNNSEAHDTSNDSNSSNDYIVKDKDFSAVIKRAIGVLLHKRSLVTPFALAIQCELIEERVPPKVCRAWLEANGWREDGKNGWIS